MFLQTSAANTWALCVPKALITFILQIALIQYFESL
jgi:hypothetical protein